MRFESLIIFKKQIIQKFKNSQKQKVMKRIFAFFSLIFILTSSVGTSMLVGAAFAVGLNEPAAFLPIAGSLFAASLFFKPEKNLMYMAFTQGICEKVQDSLVQMFKQNAPSLKRSRTGFLDALESSVNMAGVSKVQLDLNNGKVRQAKIKFIQRATDDETVTDPFNCIDDVVREPFEQIVSITHFVRTPGLAFNEADMRLLCESGQEYMAGVINAEINALMVALDKQLITLQSAGFGVIPPTGSNAAKTYNMLQGANALPIFKGESDLMEDSENMESGSKPIVVGAGNLAAYVRQVGIGCCNDGGIDLSKAGNINFFRDQNVNTILGNNHFIWMVPGYTHLLTWNENKGEFAKDTDTFSHGTIVDPVTGIEIDKNWKYDDCARKYILQMGIHFELYKLPANSFKATDPLAGVNFSAHGIAANI